MKLIKNMMLISLGLAFASPAFANDTLKVQTIKQLYITEIQGKSVDKFFDTTFLALNEKAKQIPNKSNELPPEHPDFDPYEDFGLGEISLTPADGAGDFGYNPKIKMIDYKVDKNKRVIATGWIISTDSSNIKQKFTTAFELKCSQTQCKITDLHDDTDGYYNGKFRSRKAYLIERVKRSQHQLQQDAQNAKSAKLMYAREYGQARIAFDNQRHAAALPLYKKLAANGHMSAQHELAYMYYNGIGVEKDYSWARYWFTKAAYQGNAQAQYELGKMYAFGVDNWQTDKQRGRYWLQKAAAQGYPLANQALEKLK